MKLFVVTGMSGAGKTMAIRFLEDSGYFVVDNMPPAFLPKFAELCLVSGGKLDKAAIVCDSRVGNFFGGLKEALSELDEKDIEYEIMFFEADDNTLIRRYKETRRKHPLQQNGKSLVQAIDDEREMLKDIRKLADVKIDTTDTKPKMLLEKLKKVFLDDGQKSEMKLSIISFGFKYGIPLDADIVFDVRFLPNPFYIPELKEHNGTEACVSDYVMSFKAAQVFYQKLSDIIAYLLPLYAEDSRASLVIAIGCTGGQHRSVTIAEKLYRDFGKKYNAEVEHRDYLKSLNA